MKNKNVTEIIDRLMNPDTDKIAYNATEVFTAIVHGYYYIKPGKCRVRFIKKINEILTQGHEKVTRKHAKMKKGIKFEAWICGKMATDMLLVAREMFDREYYHDQISRMVIHEDYDDTMLEYYLYCLDETKLKSVFEGILTFKENFDAFISDKNFDRMMDELTECSINVIRDSPWYMNDYDKHFAYIDNNWDFCFEYLCRETIIDIICEYVDYDQVALASMVKTFIHSDVRTASEFTGIAIWLINEFEQDVFNPQITDMNNIRLEDYDYRNSKVIYSNKSCKIMIA